MSLVPLTPDELLSTTRAVRKRLDLTRPVERDVIEECLALAQQAPSGGNTQNWDFVFVTDPTKRAALGALYRTSWYAYNAARAPAPGGVIPAARQRMVSSAMYLADHMGVTASTMSLHLDKLEGGGFVRRVRSRVDARRVELRLTPAGVRIKRQQKVLDPRLVDLMLVNLTDAERRKALEGLELLARAASQLIATKQFRQTIRGSLQGSDTGKAKREEIPPLKKGLRP